MKIVEYHRPQSLNAALELLARDGILTIPLGGGTRLNLPVYQNAHFMDDISVVDLQALNLNSVEQNGTFTEIGGAVTLQALLDYPELPAALHQAVRLETTFNLRQVATVAGTLVAADGRSPFCTAMLGLDARLTILSKENQPGEEIHLGDLLPFRDERLRRHLITKVAFLSNTRLAFEYVARTPADQPIVCAAVARWPSGRTRVSLGGYGPQPIGAMDGPEPGGVEAAARAAYSQAGDTWASADYRGDVAGVLAKRCLNALSDTSEV